MPKARLKIITLLALAFVFCVFSAHSAFAPLIETAYADPGFVAVDIDYIVDPEAIYQTAGVFTSTNLLPTSGAELINNFSYTATVPAGTTLQAQFSYDNVNWYNSSETLNAWDTLSDGTNLIDFSPLEWGGSMFHYKMFFTSTDGSATASLDSITLSYNSYSGEYDTYDTTGSFTSTNLLSGLTTATIDSFACDVMSLPPNTTASAQFSADNSTWYKSDGTLNGSDTLSAGSNTISLATLGWSGSAFYYKMTLTSDGTYTPAIDSITLNYSAPTTFTSTQTGAFNIGTTWGGLCSSSCTAGTDFPDTADVAIVAIGTTVTLDSARTISNLTVNSGGTLDLAGYNLTANPITLTGTLKFKGSETVSSTPTINTGSIVTYDGDTTPVTVKNWSYKTLNLNAPGKQFNFTAGADYSVATALNINGSAGNLVTLRSTSTDTQWNIAVPATHSLSYIDVKDSNNTGTTIDATNTSLFTDSGNNTGWTFDTVAPTTSADPSTGSGQVYTFNTWTSSSVNVTLACQDNEGGTGCSTTYYCTDTSNSCVPSTLYFEPVTVTTEGTSYIRYYSTDTVPNTETTASSTIKIDTTAPVTVVSETRDGNAITKTLTCTDTSGSGCTYTYYCIDTPTSPVGECTPTTVYSSPVSYQIEGATYFRYYSLDAMSNTNSVLSSRTGPVGGGPAYNQTPPPTPTQTTTPDTTTQQDTNLIQQITEQITSIFTPQTPESQISYPPIEESVPEKAPVALQGWDIMTVKPVGEVALTPIDSDISFFAEKIPQLQKTLLAFGIETSKISDIQKVQGTEFYLPGLTQTVLTQTEILAIAEENKQKAITAPDIFQTSGFALPSAVPLASLTPEAKQKIPTDIVFARTGGELIDYSIAISVDKDGQVEQKIETISEKPMQLVIKPDQPAERVTGFISLKKSAVGLNNQTKESQVLAFISRISGADLLASIQNLSQPAQEKTLLVDKFAYTETESGIFTASISAPKNEGEYEISTVIEFKDILVDPKETKMTAIVNPEGYVFSQLADGRLRIKGASVSLYQFNSETGQYEVWPAEKFLQKNPIITDETGKYSFLVSNGTYKLKAEALGYENYESEPFEMKEQITVSQNIELKKKSGLLGWLSWQNIVIALLFMVIILLIAIIIIFAKRSINKNYINK